MFFCNFQRWIILGKVCFARFFFMNFFFGLEISHYGRSLRSCSSISAKSFQCISFYFRYGFTWDSRAWIFSSSSLIFSSFFWDSAWASCRALNSSSNCREKKRVSGLSVRTQQTRVNTRGVGERHGASSQTAAGHINRRRKHAALLSGRRLFIALVALKPAHLWSLFPASAFMYVDGSNLCGKRALSLQWLQTPSRAHVGLVGRDPWEENTAGTPSVLTYRGNDVTRAKFRGLSQWRF